MIPVSVSDLLKILDQIPVWKNLASLPRRLAALEARVEGLESTKTALPLTPTVNPAKACPMCSAEMKVIAEHPHPMFEFAGLKIHDMSCPECGHKTSRDFQPGNGYK